MRDFLVSSNFLVIDTETALGWSQLTKHRNDRSKSGSNFPIIFVAAFYFLAAVAVSRTHTHEHSLTHTHTSTEIYVTHSWGTEKTLRIGQNTKPFLFDLCF